ncbi:MAG TPA: Gfo/Idh/MocA family oxidoreductase [Candidatus Acidoferrales bacterium]|nr:Gfo/Idh/MocA family oxidoreductase [Candidatus Acidoferrales bacterium]
MTLGWGIIGPGGIAGRSIAPGIGADPNSQLVAVVSRDQGRAEAFAKLHGAAWAGTDFDEMLRRPDVDVVVITTPNFLHAEQVTAAARAGKHVLCDKPLAGSAEEAAKVVDVCASAGVRLGLNFQTRHHAAFQDARRVIQSGQIGDVVVVQVDAGNGGRLPRGWRLDPAQAGLGAVNNIAVHMYDLLRFLLDSEVVEVVAMFETGRGPAIELCPMVLLRFASGAMAYANGNQVAAKPLDEIVIHGTKGRIDGRRVTRPSPDGEMRVVTESGESVAAYSSMDAYARTIAAFSAAVLEGRQPNPSGVDGLRSVELTDAIARSVREGSVVSVSS